MQVLNILVLKILEMSLRAGVVIITVLLVRSLLRGLPKSYAYMLWIVVAFRLVVPFSADSDISIFNLLAKESIDSGINADNRGETRQNTVGSHGADEVSAVNIDGQAEQEGYVQNKTIHSANDIQSTLDAKAVAESEQTQDIRYLDIFSDFKSIYDGRGIYRSVGTDDNLINIMTLVWIAGMMALVTYTAISHMRIKRKIRYSVRLYDNVYECDQIRSPFVYGMIRPRICLPFRLRETERQCIVTHERYHMKRKDYLIKPFAYVLVMVYWFQPLVWIAYHFMCTDMEMSCDEKIISGFTVEMRKEYSRLLLAFATNKRQHPASPLAFGEEDTMKRIRNILHYKKAAQWRLVGGAVAIMLTMAACATDARTDETVASVSDQTVPVQNDLTGASDQSESSIEDNIGNAVSDNSADSDTVATTANGTGVATHHSERHHTDRSGQETQHHVIGHHQAQWAENSMCDMELCSLDYADSDKIVFHISSGMFQYDLQEQRITRSIDLKALNCQEVQTGGKCRITVYKSSDSNLRVAIAPYPYSDENSFVYDLASDELFAYDDGLLEGYTLFDGLVSKYDLPEEDRLKGWKHAENILPVGEHSYGVLGWDLLELDTMYYEAGGQRWELFHKEQATLPRLVKQDDSFYQAIAMYSGKEIDQCLLDYMGLYNMHDYAGVCALSTGLEYSDEMQQEFSGYPYILSGAENVSHSNDETEYLFQFLCGDGYGTGEKVYVNFKYLDGEGWRAEGFPHISEGDQ